MSFKDLGHNCVENRRTVGPAHADSLYDEYPPQGVEAADMIDVLCFYRKLVVRGYKVKTTIDAIAVSCHPVPELVNQWNRRLTRYQDPIG